MWRRPPQERRDEKVAIVLVFFFLLVVVLRAAAPRLQDREAAGARAARDDGEARALELVESRGDVEAAPALVDDGADVLEPAGQRAKVEEPRDERPARPQAAPRVPQEGPELVGEAQRVEVVDG